MSKSLTVGIIDYGVGNLRSLAGAVSACGYEPIVSREASELGRTSCLMLPGVGAFGDGMAELASRNLIKPLSEMVSSGSHSILGICLGAQLLATRGTEFGEHKGLGWIEGTVLKIETHDSTLKLPHVGWNEVRRPKPSILYENIPDDALFYFVHTFHVVCDRSLMTGETEYGGSVTASFEKKNVFGVQFHPEKSQRHGLTLLKNFLRFVGESRGA